MKIKMYSVRGKELNRVTSEIGDNWIKHLELDDSENDLYNIEIDAIVKINSDRVWIDSRGNKDYFDSEDFEIIKIV